MEYNRPPNRKVKRPFPSFSISFPKTGTCRRNGNHRYFFHSNKASTFRTQPTFRKAQGAYFRTYRRFSRWGSVSSNSPSVSVLAPASPSVLAAVSASLLRAGITISPTLSSGPRITLPYTSYPPPLVAEVGLIEAVGKGGGGLGPLPPTAAESSSRMAAIDSYWNACGAMEALLAPRALLAPVALWDSLAAPLLRCASRSRTASSLSFATQRSGTKCTKGTAPTARLGWR